MRRVYTTGHRPTPTRAARQEAPTKVPRMTHLKTQVCWGLHILSGISTCQRFMGPGKVRGRGPLPGVGLPGGGASVAAGTRGSCEGSAATWASRTMIHRFQQDCFKHSQLKGFQGVGDPHFTPKGRLPPSHGRAEPAEQASSMHEQGTNRVMAPGIPGTWRLEQSHPSRPRA